MHESDGVISQRETQHSTETLRASIIDTYHNGLAVLEDALGRNKKESHLSDETERKPRGTVVVSLYEEDESLLTAHMFKHSITELVKQAGQAGLALDVIIVANNGGGATPEVGRLMGNKVMETINSIPEFGEITHVSTIRPNVEAIDAATPWKIPANIADAQKSSKDHRIIYIEQGFDKLNKGKIRALRDVANFLCEQIIDEGYSPDFVFQMDAETILKYNDKRLEGSIPPLKVLYNQISRGGKIAAGTKDKFAIMDPETGLPLATPVGSSQKGYEATNSADKFVTLPGGALMARPAPYSAGMVAISRHTPSMGVEDYMLTKLLRADAKARGQELEDVAVSVGQITHLNRTPRDWKQAIRQMANWRSHARAADEIFPGDPYNTEPIGRYVALVVAARFQDALAGGPTHLLKLIRDVQDLPAVRAFIYDEAVPDISNKQQGVSWTSNKQ